MSEGRLWGGRFVAGPSSELVALSKSTHFDWRLAPYDLLQTRAYVDALAQAGFLNQTDGDSLSVAIDQLLSEVAADAVSPLPTDEDVHSALERLLIERVGDLGSKARFGRSRNDQVATDLRLYLRDAGRAIATVLLDLHDSLVGVAAANSLVIATGFTHLQHAQPLLLGHEIAKHAHRMARDVSRLQDWDVRASVSPLGAGAVAGTAARVDLEVLARALGFTAVAGNSVDATTDRDFVAELCFVLALVGVHLSQLGEEIALWSSAEFGWVTLDESWSTGSSIMPQKKNPDIAELARGKAGRLIGDLVSVLTTLKGLPFGYNRDLQEDKEPVFDAIDTVILVAPALTGLVSTLQFDGARVGSAVTTGHPLATEIADWLALRGVPFREAHEHAGACVRLADERGVELSELTDAEFASVTPELISAVRKVLSPASAIAARRATGGTGDLDDQLQHLRANSHNPRGWADFRSMKMSQ